MSDAGIGVLVAAAARNWIGTPYRHQASCKGAGADCLGLIRGVWREILGEEPEEVPAYSWDWGETSLEEKLWGAAERCLEAKPLDQPAIGDVLLFRMKDKAVAKHLGIQSTQNHFIHAYSGHAVVENSFSRPWRSRLVARFEFPSGDK